MAGPLVEKSTAMDARRESSGWLCHVGGRWQRAHAQFSMITTELTQAQSHRDTFAGSRTSEGKEVRREWPARAGAGRRGRERHGTRPMSDFA
jgi:hypothetical protein